MVNLSPVIELIWFTVGVQVGPPYPSLAAAAQQLLKEGLAGAERLVSDLAQLRWVQGSVGFCATHIYVWRLRRKQKSQKKSQLCGMCCAASVGSLGCQVEMFALWVGAICYHAHCRWGHIVGKM